MVQRTGFLSTCYLVQLVVADVESDKLDLASECWLCGGMGEGVEEHDYDYVDGDHDLVLDIYDYADFDT